MILLDIHNTIYLVFSFYSKRLVCSKIITNLCNDATRTIHFFKISLPSSFAGELDDKMKWLKNFDRLLEIQRNIVWPSVLEMDSKQYFPEFLKSALSKQPCERLIVSPRRQILIEGQLLLLDYGKPNDMHVILFDDLLLITRRKKSISKKVSLKSKFCIVFV